MGNQVRTPRPIYFKHGVIEFYTKKRTIYFKVKLWINEITQILFREGIFNITTDELTNEATQFLSSVEVKKN